MFVSQMLPSAPGVLPTCLIWNVSTCGNGNSLGSKSNLQLMLTEILLLYKGWQLHWFEELLNLKASWNLFEFLPQFAHQLIKHCLHHNCEDTFNLMST